MAFIGTVVSLCGVHGLAILIAVLEVLACLADLGVFSP